VTSPPDTNRQPATPRPAATVLLLREGRDCVEVLAIRRHEKLAFMGGMWVFPGGSVCAADTSPESLAIIPEQSQAGCARLSTLTGEAIDRLQCLGLAVAACRETFEETGVLLASNDAGDHCDSELTARVQERRHAIAAQPELFASLLQEQQLFLRVDRLAYWAHWITPSIVPRRFDTRFFLAVVPSDQLAVIDSTETIDHAWMSPAALVAAADAGSLSVSHPTLYNLMELDASLHEHGSLQDLLSATASRQVIPILPKMVHEEQTAMVLPWDPFYRNFLGESAPEHLEYPARLRALPSRMLAKR
jgi:8-oxo-dGTP pyrophosphatase MutT (NUDIX family)